MILTGGERDDAQKFIAPTLLTGVSPEAAIMGQEIFGPVLPIFSYRDLDEPIAAINARPKPLALYIFAKDRAKTQRILQETSAGGSCVNATIFNSRMTICRLAASAHSGLGNSHGLLWFPRLLA